jgi:hypothetical protein
LQPVIASFPHQPQGPTPTLQRLPRSGGEPFAGKVFEGFQEPTGRNLGERVQESTFFLFEI